MPFFCMTIYMSVWLGLYIIFSLLFVETRTYDVLDMYVDIKREKLKEHNPKMSYIISMMPSTVY